ncbi:MAG: hypothetical protein JNM88_16650 [Chitinophagaceae bacterium]|nr:hypothetical protein [Chitinophagaceae bacterium]
MIKAVVSSLLIISISFSANAQLGGLIKKAKDKTTEPKQEKTTPPPSNTQTTPAQQPAQQSGATQPAAKTIPPPEERKELWPEGHINYVKPDAPTPLHSKYVGKLVFSNQVLTPETTKETLFKNSFSIDEPIYGRVYIATAVKNYVLYSDMGAGSNGWDNNDGECSLQYTIDNDTKVHVLRNYRRKGDTKSWITWQYFFAARGEDAAYNQDDFIGKMNALPDGEHIIHFKLWAGGIAGRSSISPIATADLTINKQPGKKMILGRTWNSYKATMSNPALEKQMVDVMKEKASRDGWKETFSKAKIIDKDWYTVRNEYTGIVTARTINAVVYAKWPDGHCTVQEFNFIQQHNGSGWSKVLEFNGVGDQTAIDCD